MIRYIIQQGACPFSPMDENARKTIKRKKEARHSQG
jgi:hypothetical protein